MNSVHFSEENSEGFVCPKCTQISNSYDSLKEHIKENHPKSCNICHEEVKNMSAHIREFNFCVELSVFLSEGRFLHEIVVICIIYPYILLRQI